MLSTKKSKKESTLLSKTLRFCVEVFLVAFVVLLVVYVFEYVNQRSFLLDDQNIKPGKSYRMESNMTTVVLGEETEAEVEEPVFESENYKIRQITFGGDTTIPLDRIENVPLEITSVRSELLTTRDEQEAKLIVSWKTNKPAISEIVFGKNIEQGGTSIKEDKYGYSHSAVLSALDYSSAYTYLIKSKDKWSNELSSDQFAFYTGAPKISLVDLLLGAFRDVFSWAISE
jgi:hypothetical protein